MNRLPPILLITLTLLVFGHVCAAEFVEWDDPSTITRDPAFNPPTLKSVANYWLHPQLNIYIPMTCTVWGMLATVGRLTQADEAGSSLNPWAFHAANLFVHLINVLLVWKIARALSRDRFAAWFAAAIFAVHPLQVEAVAWATDMKDLLCTGFSFAAILGWMRFRKREDLRALILATLALIAACLSKPTGVVTPIIVLIIDIMLLGNSFGRSIKTLWIWFVVAMMFAIVAKIVQPPVLANVAPAWIRPLIAADAIAFYLWKIIWPMQLAIDYGRTPARALAQGWLAFTWIVPVFLAAIICWRGRKSPSIAAGALIFVASLLPVLGLIPFTFQSLSTVADHYVYLPMLGVCVAISFLNIRKSTIVIAVVLVGAMSVRSFFAGETWHDNSTLFTNAMAVNPRSAMAQSNWAVTLVHRGDDDDAIAHLRAAIAIDPDYGFAHFNLAGLLVKHGQQPEAIEQYREFFRIYRAQKNYDPATERDAEAQLSHLLKQLENR